MKHTNQPFLSERYARHFSLPEIGIKGQELLRQSRVIVIGAGGLGCPILQYLAAAGVGTIGIVDGDIVSLSNLQRQILYTMDDIGMPKAEVASYRLLKCNNSIVVHSHPVYLNDTNAFSLLANYDVIVDATDNFSARYLINDACVILNKPFVAGAIYAFEGHLSVYNYQDGPTYRCVFPEVIASEIPSCSETGVLGVLPGIIGCLQASEVIKILLNIGTTLSGKLLCCNLLTMKWTEFAIEAHADRKNIHSLKPAKECTLQDREISSSDLKKLLLSTKECTLIDVRNENERDSFKLDGLHIPLHNLSENFNPNTTTPIIFYCQTGVRSRKACELILSKWPGVDVYSLKYGISTWVE